MKKIYAMNGRQKNKITKKEIHCVVIKVVIDGRGLCVEFNNDVDFVHFTPVKLMTFVSLHEYIFPYSVDSTQQR